MTLLDRRNVLLAGAGISGVALARSAGAVGGVGEARGGASAASVTVLDLANPRTALDAYVKLRGSTADETVFQPYEGDIFLVADGQVGIPLVGFRGIQKSRWRPDDAGGYVHTDYDVGFYVDYATRQRLDTWHNPLTGRTVEVFHYRSGPSGGRFEVGNEGGDAYGGMRGRWQVAGDQIIHTAAHWGERPNPLTPEEWPLASSGRTVLSSMSLSFSARLHDIADPGVQRPQSLQVWTHAAAWMPWMEMGQRPGCNLWRWIGTKGVERRDLPADLVRMTEAAWPGYVVRDSGWKEPTYGALDYMRARRGLEPTK